MKNANWVLGAAVAAALLLGPVGSFYAPVAAAADEKAKAAETPKVGAKVGKPLKAAQDAIAAKNWDEALARIQEAQAVDPKTPYEQYMTNEMLYYVMVQKRQFKEAGAILEQQLASGQVPAAELPTKYKTAAALANQNGEPAKAVEFAKKYVELEPGDPVGMTLLGQAYYLQKDYQNAATTMKQVVAASPKPSEQALNILLQSQAQLKDRAGALATLQALVRGYPKHEYWDDLLSNTLFQTKDARERRYLYRLMEDTGTLEEGESYAEMGTDLLEGGYPSEAQRILEKGMAANLFQGVDKERAQVSLEQARKGAAADRSEAAGADKALAAAKTADEMVGIGKLYFSLGDYGKAAEAVQKGIAKGGVKDLDDANMLLAVSRARSNQSAEAQAALAAVKDPRLAPLATLWKLRLETLAAPAAPAAGG